MGCYLRDDIRLYFLYHNSAAGYYRVCSCFKVLLKFKMAAMDKLHIFLWAQEDEKLKSVIIHIVQSHYPPSGNVHVILLKFEKATTNQLFKYL